MQPVHWCACIARPNHQQVTQDTGRPDWANPGIVCMLAGRARLVASGLTSSHGCCGYAVSRLPRATGCWHHQLRSLCGSCTVCACVRHRGLATPAAQRALHGLHGLLPPFTSSLETEVSADACAAYRHGTCRGPWRLRRPAAMPCTCRGGHQPGICSHLLGRAGYH